MTDSFAFEWEATAHTALVQVPGGTGVGASQPAVFHNVADPAIAHKQPCTAEVRRRESRGMNPIQDGMVSRRPGAAHTLNAGPGLSGVDAPGAAKSVAIVSSLARSCPGIDLLAGSLRCMAGDLFCVGSEPRSGRDVARVCCASSTCCLRTDGDFCFTEKGAILSRTWAKSASADGDPDHRARITGMGCD